MGVCTQQYAFIEFHEVNYNLAIRYAHNTLPGFLTPLVVPPSLTLPSSTTQLVLTQIFPSREELNKI